MKLKNCNNISDFRLMAQKRLPDPIFQYIDGGSDDESTLRRNTSAFEDYDLVPSILTDVSKLDLSTTVFGKKINLPLFLSPTAMHRLYYHEGEKATAKAAETFDTMFGLSTMSTTRIEDISQLISSPKLFQIYIHKDRGLTDNLVDRCKNSGFDAMCLTVDTVVAGNRERDLVTGFTTPPRLTLKSMLSFLTHPYWSFHYLTGKKFELSNVIDFTKKGTDIEKSVIDYIDEQFDPSMDWSDAEYIRKKWDGPFAIKGIMSTEDAKRAIDIGATAVIVSNHGGRQLDGSRVPFDQLASIVDAVDGKIEVILDGGVRRGTHVLKALALGAKACMFGKGYLYGLAAGGQAGVEAVLSKMKSEITRDMILMGCKSIKEVDQSRIIKR